MKSSDTRILSLAVQPCSAARDGVENWSGRRDRLTVGHEFPTVHPALFIFKPGFWRIRDWARGVFWSRVVIVEGDGAGLKKGSVRPAPRDTERMSVQPLPLVVSMGDPNGVGPEILLRVRAEEPDADWVVTGSLAVLERTARALNLSVSFQAIPTADAPVSSGRLGVLDVGGFAAAYHQPGQSNAQAGALARAAIVRGVSEVIEGRGAALVTLPVSKAAIALCDPAFVGHTELLADLCEVPRDQVVMLLVNRDLAVSHVTAHVPLAQVPGLLHPERIRHVIQLTAQTVARWCPEPRIAVCGLNPHAGEGGLLGAEDEGIIAPVIRALAGEGLRVSGPHPADTVFHAAIHQRRYDAVVAMYHDQGHAPMKLHDFATGVNCTLGLPIIRTSVDHGTAFDLAGTGKADPTSFRWALRRAAQWASFSSQSSSPVGWG